jgi:hypothetical protein
MCHCGWYAVVQPARDLVLAVTATSERTDDILVRSAPSSKTITLDDANVPLRSGVGMHGPVRILSAS